MKNRNKRNKNVELDQVDLFFGPKSAIFKTWKYSVMSQMFWKSQSAKQLAPRCVAHKVAVSFKQQKQKLEPNSKNRTKFVPPY